MRPFCLFARAAAVFAASLVPLVAGAQAPGKLPLESFFENPAFGTARLSPTGRYIALSTTRKGGRTQMAVLDTEKLTAKVIASPSDADIYRIEWVNDDRLVFNVVDKETAQRDTGLNGGLYSVARDGSDFRQIVDRLQPGVRERGDGVGLLDAFTFLIGTNFAKTSDDIFVAQAGFNSRHEYDFSNVLRVDARTGRSYPYQRPGRTREWLIDSTNVPRVALTYEEGRSALHRLQGDTWQKLVEFKAIGADAIEPLGLGVDGSLYVVARNGRDREALYRFDMDKKALDAEPILLLPENDFEGSLLFDKSRVLGIRYRSDAWATAWFDPKMKALQAKLDAQLPGTVNLIDVPVRGEVPFVMVRSFSDTDPGTYWLYQTETGKLTSFGQVMRDIDPKRMAQRDLVHYKARDGLNIPAWLTLPKGGKGKKLPLVVLVHGGPWAQAAGWRWDSESQFLASRGYAVLEPEFRGSTGWGARLFNAGLKQWGLAMQDDLADGAKWAMAQGITEAGRICIAGASYGGYATLMGLIKEPDLYKCGVAWAGVSDIDLMYSVQWSDLHTDHKTYNMPTLIGDREKDAAQLKATSPLQQAARLKQPLLLAHGGGDRRVPIVHSIKFRDAVKQTNSDVEWVEYVEEGHGWYLVKNRIDFWTRVEKFLDRNIGAR